MFTLVWFGVYHMFYRYMNYDLPHVLPSYIWGLPHIQTQLT